MKRLRRAVTAFIFLGLIGLGALLLYGHARNHPEDMPWTELDLGLPIGAFTGRKLADLADEGPLCRDLLRRAGIAFASLPARSAQGGQCGYEDAVHLEPEGALAIDYRPSNLG